MAFNRPFGGDGALALFARDFDDPAARDGVIVLDEQEPPDAASELAPPSISTAALEEACAAARAEGLRQGYAEAAAIRDTECDALVANLILGLNRADAHMRDAVEEASSRLAELVLAMLAAGFPTLCARHGAAEVARFTRDVVALLGQEPRIVIRVNPALESTLEEVLAELEQEQRDAILIEPRDNLPPGDARIAWRHGLASRDIGVLRARLAEALGHLGLAPVDTNFVVADPVIGASLPLTD